MEPTLTLQIPFILLGRRDTHILDPTALSPHEQATQPITLILRTLQRFCPTVSVHPWALDALDWQVPPRNTLTTEAKRAHMAAQETAREHAQRAAEEQWRTLTSGGSEVWILRPAPSSSVFLSGIGLQEWREGDGYLTPAEAARLGDNVWTCPVLLQRFGISTNTMSSAWTRFMRETGELFGALRGAFADFHGTIGASERKVKYWDVLVGGNCFLKTVVGPLGAEAGHKLLVLAAAFERELDMLRTPGELVEFVGLGRWLEWMLLRKMASMQSEAWRCFEEERHHRISGEQEPWKNHPSVEDEKYRRTKGRIREWWDVMHDMEDIDIVEGMHKFENNGTIRLSTALHTSADHIHQLAFQGRRSTLNAAQLLAHTELLARFVDTAQKLSLVALAAQLETAQLDQPTDADRFWNMLSFLRDDSCRRSEASESVLMACLNPIDCTARSQLEGATVLAPRPTRPQEAVDPFYGVRRYLERRYEAERADMVSFIERYSRVGGYRPTIEKKLLAMLKPGEDTLKGRDCGQQKARLESGTVDAPLGIENRGSSDVTPVQVENGKNGARITVMEWLRHMG